MPAQEHNEPWAETARAAERCNSTAQPSTTVSSRHRSTIQPSQLPRVTRVCPVHTAVVGRRYLKRSEWQSLPENRIDRGHLMCKV